MFQYQKQNRYFAQIAAGFDEVAEAELRELGASSITPAFRGLHFEADQTVLYRILYQSRLIVRVLAPLITFDCHSDRYLYNTACKIDWSEFISPQETFAVQAVTSNTPSLRHSQYAALKVKDAICDSFREKTGKRPSVDVKNPDLGIHLFVRNNRATLSIDLSGGSLHKRGYRTERVDAPMQETLAAAVIRLSGWNGERPLIDPMCGSGTLLCEAAMHACRIPAGFLRTSWGIERMPDFCRPAWHSVRKEADDAMRPLPAGLISGSDIDDGAVRAARIHMANLPRCGTGVRIEKRDFRGIRKIEQAVIVTNPPYGVRLGERAGAEALLKEFGDFLKQRCTGCTAWIYAGDARLLKKVGLKPGSKHPLNNGGLEGVLGKFELYSD